MVAVYDIKGTKIKDIQLPKIFYSEIREDIINRAFLSYLSKIRQPYGTDILAGLRTSAHYHGRGRGYYSMKNREMARIQRIHGGNPGQELRAKVAPQARSGRRAHPPKVEKKFELKINKKEKKLALLSSIAATANYELVSKRHKIPKIDLPLVISDDFENISKTKDAKNILISLNLKDELKRAKNKKIRAGKGKMRGRKYKQKRSLLIISKNDKNLKKAFENIPGIDVCKVSNISVNLLAPGGKPGRLTLWTESAIKELEKYG
ncbi:MAG: 50S ribosomal protein L4 [Candidatus Aenigmatarchaeota archaeon]|nr:50S ribosomal protein L4 [Candidatus Aenigmarchaeota archaeon]